MKSMARLLAATLVVVLVCGGGTGALQAQTIDQKLSVVRNDGTMAGQFNIVVQVKGTGLGAANTLSSGTIDVQFDNTKLTYVNATLWALSGTAYNRTANNNTTFIRLAITGGGVNSNGDGTPAGFDVSASYTTLVQLNFTLASTVGPTNLTIAPGSNALSLFQNHNNDPDNGVSLGQALSAPVNILNQSLPIQLVSFTATIQSGSGSSVVLRWKTLSETDNLGFEVERSLAAAGPFEAIAGSFQPGHGTTVEPQEYSFTDPNAEGKNWYYRLKQTDRSGAIHYSDPVQAIVAGVPEQNPLPTLFALDQNYPNPFNPTTVIRYQLPVASQVRLVVFDVLGREVATLTNGVREAGYHSESFNASGLGSGFYFYQLKAGEQTFLKKMLLVK